MIKLTQNDLAEMMRVANERVGHKKEEINKINVFPVPDQDTGTNLAFTLSGIYAAIQGKTFGSVKELGERVLEGALASAQGNAGVIFTGFLAGFFPALDGRDVDAKTFAAAFLEGAKRARDSIQNPREGTMLDVIDAAAMSLKKGAENSSDIVEITAVAARDAAAALLATREKMEVFKKANVVDAGGLGFLIIIESFLAAVGKSFHGGETGPEFGEEALQPFAETESFSEAAGKDIGSISHRFEVAGLLEAGEDKANFNEQAVKEVLKGLGDFIDVVKVGEKMRIHVHTNRPEDAEAAIRQFGKVVTIRVQDMSYELAGASSVMPSSIGIVTEDIADLNQKTIEHYKIEIARTSVNWPDGEKVPGENLYQKMRAAAGLGVKTFPKTSQASPEQYLDAYKKQRAVFKKVLCVTISSMLSGSFNSAKVAAGLAGNDVFVFDSRHVSVGQGMVVLKAVELAREGKGIEEILKGLEAASKKIKLYVIFEEPKWIEAGGRLTKSQAAWVRRLKQLNFHPLITVKDGALAKDGIVFARNNAEALFKKVAKDSARDRAAGKKIRTVIAHADNETGAKMLKKMLKEKIGAEVSYITMASPTLGVHAGPGSLIVAWTTVD